MPRAKGQPRKLTLSEQEWIRAALVFRRGLSNKALMRKFDISEVTLWSIGRKYDKLAAKYGQKEINNRFEREFAEFLEWRSQREGSSPGLNGSRAESTGDSHNEIPNRLPASGASLPDSMDETGSGAETLST